MGKEPNTAVSEPKTGIMSSILRFFGRLAIAPGKMLIYPVWPIKVIRSVEVTWPVKFTLPLVAYPKNWRKSFGEIWHDFKNGLRGLINSPPEEYNPPISMSEDSRSVGITVESYEKGVYVLLKMPRSRIGDIPYLTDEQLEEIEKKLPNVLIFRGENKIVMKINVKQIVTDHELLKKIREEFGPNVSEEAIKTLAIAREIDRNFKELAKITRGELGNDTDPKLFYDTAQALYSKHIEQQEKSAEAVTPQNNQLSKEILKHVGKVLSKTMSASPQSVNTEQPEKSSEVVIPEENKRSPGALKHSGTGFADTVLSSKREKNLKGV